MTNYTIIQMPASLGRRGFENGIIMLSNKAGSFMIQGEKVHGESLTVDVNCPSGKDAYPTYATAAKALRMKSRHGQKTKRIHKCRECGYFHFTTNDGTTRKPRPYSREKEKKIARMQMAPYESHSEKITPGGFSMKRFQNNRNRMMESVSSPIRHKTSV